MRAKWVCSRGRRIGLYKRSSINQKAGDHVSTPPPTSPFFLLYCRFGRLSDAKCPRPDVRFSQFIFGSQIINLNYRFCHNFFFFFSFSFLLLLLLLLLLFASFTDFYFILSEQPWNSLSFVRVFFSFFSFLPPMEYSPSVKEASTKVIVAKTVIIINHSAARAKSGWLWNCKIHFATEQ